MYPGIYQQALIVTAVLTGLCQAPSLPDNNSRINYVHKCKLVIATVFQ